MKKNKLYFYFFKLALLLYVVTLVSCENDKAGNFQETNTPDSTKIVKQEAPDLAISSGLIGKWELLEQRLPEVHLVGDVFFDFKPQGQLTISNPKDKDLENLDTDYYLEASTLGYDGSVFDVLYFQKDSLALEGDIDGIKEISIFRKIH